LVPDEARTCGSLGYTIARRPSKPAAVVSGIACSLVGAEFVSEPISPELVLVDPELARRERARPIGDTRSQASVDSVVARAQEALPPQPRPLVLPPPRSRERTVARGFSRSALIALLTISLMANGVLVALNLPRERGERQTRALPEVVSGSDAAVGHARSASASTATSRQPGSSTPRRQAATTKPQRSPSPLTTRRTATRSDHRKATTRKRGSAAVAPSKLPLETNAAVELKVLALVVQSPVGKLPPTLIDQRTGLAKNNLQAVCRRTSDSRSFRCVVESAVNPESGRVYVYYRPTRDGRGRFAWSRDRSG
jgi:hypothetical protein